MKRTQITKRIRKLLVVAGASMVLAAVPASAALASFPDETTQSEFHGCQNLAPRMHETCEQYFEQVFAGSSDEAGLTSEEASATSTSGSDMWPDAEYLWIAASIGAVGGAAVALLHRRQPPLVS